MRAEQRQAQQLEEISGSVEHIVYRNTDNGFTVFEVGVEGELLCAVGEILELQPGEEVTLTGSFTAHPTYGRQFRVEMCVKNLPTSAGAILRYLEGRAVKGIGGVTARRLVDRFGERTLDIIEHEPEQMTVIKGITLKKAREISAEFRKVHGIRAVMAELAQYRLGASHSIKVWKKWGADSVRMIRQNPYDLCSDAIGVPFEAADELAVQLEIGADDPRRIEAGILYILAHNMGNGHTCLPERKVREMTAQFLGTGGDTVETGLASLAENERLVLDTIDGREYVYRNDLYAAECYAAGRLLMLGSIAAQYSPPQEEQIEALERESGIQYESLQRDAIRQAMSSSVFVLTGGPGTGKTTTLNAIIRLAEQKGESVALAAPTGRAAKRLSEVTGREAKTIHRLLEVNFSDDETAKFKRNERNPLKADVVIIDEMSMVDILLFESLLRALRLTCRLILVGDSDQLPSVGAGNVLGDLIRSEMIATVQLKQIFRQAAESMIVTNAHAIVSGEYPAVAATNNDFFLLKRERYEDAMSTVIELCCARLPKSYGFSGVWDVQVLAPGRKGDLGTVSLNAGLQAAMNPPSEAKREFKTEWCVFREQDKIMQIKNNYDLIWQRFPAGTTDAEMLSGRTEPEEEGAGVFNGDIGRIISIDRAEKTLAVLFDDRMAIYSFDLASELELAYAVTIHKSQGSEYEAVIIPLMRPNERLYFRNLLYTGVTRAKRLLIIVGTMERVQYMVDNNRKVVRYSNLHKLLKRGLDG